ncbi:hypothetical protein, partial [Helicobacter labetoulli]
MKYKKFVLSYFMILLIFGLLLVGIFYYLSRIFEHNSFESIVKRQLEQNSIYGTALNENVFAYKLELVKQIKPKIIALGASRVLQFREKFFIDSFVSAGNAMNTLKEGRLFLEEVLKFYKPEIVILGLDIWWFNALYPNYERGEYFNITGTNISTTKILDIAKHIYNQQFFQSQYLLDNHFITNPYSNLDSLGLNAIYNGRGFFKDGSYLYGEIFKNEKTKDANFTDTLLRITQGISRFEYASHIDAKRMQDLFDILNLLEKHHIQVVIFIPPLAPSVYQAMQDKQEKYAYIDELFATLQKYHIPFFNYHNPAVLHNDNCEFLDGFHGGDVFYARILADMAQKSEILKSYVNMPYLTELIRTHKGRVFSKDSVSDLKEQDFLNLGC